MNRYRFLPALLLGALLLAPATLAQERLAPTDRLDAAEPLPLVVRPEAGAAFGLEDTLPAERPERYRYDPATGRPTLTPEGQAEAERLAAGRREAGLAWLPKPDRGSRTTSPAALVYRSGALVLTVNSAFDNPDQTPGDGICKIAPFSECTLRAAIQEAVAQPDTQPVFIEFAITFGPIASSGGAWTIPVNHDDGFGANGRLPYADQPDLTINGLTQPGAVCGDLRGGTTHSLKVILDGINTTNGNGLDSIEPTFTVRGLVVQNFGFGFGINALGEGSFAECNYVGTDYTGELARGNFDGLYLDGTVWNNLVSGNRGSGIVPQSGFVGVTPSPLIARNLVGTDDDGLQALGNGGTGIFVWRNNQAVIDNVVSANGFNEFFYGIHLSGARGVQVTNNIVGLSRLSTDLGLGNNVSGIYVSGGASNNNIGLPGSGNFVSGNFEGIHVTGTGTNGNYIRSNTVGLSSGAVAAGNSRAGIRVALAANGTVVGGSGAGEGNVVSGNGDYGVLLDRDTNTRVEGNTVGLTAAGVVRPNVGGIELAGSASPIVRGNTVSGNTLMGVLATSASGGSLTTNALIENNRVGTTAAGTAARANGLSGIAVVGITGTVVRGNVASANGDHGIYLTGTTRDVVEGNTVGTDPSGTLDLGNGLHGVYCLFASDSRISSANTIAFNTGAGVFLESGCQNVAVLESGIYNNDGLGIDLAPGGVTPNDPDDADTGANQLTNFPVLTSIGNDGSNVTITFTLDALSNQLYRVELFTSPSADPSGFGEGRLFRVSTNATTNAAGLATVTIINLPTVFPGGQWVTATATPVASGTFTGFRGTSEFSAARQVPTTLPPLTVSITPTSPLPPVVLARGERVFFDLTFQVGPSGSSSFQYWTEAVLPNQQVRGPLIGPNTLMVTPPQTVTLSFSQRVPASAPLGTYLYRVEAGLFPDSVFASDSFSATVAASGLAARSVDEDGGAGDEAWVAYDAEGRVVEAGTVLDLRTDEGETTEAASRGDEALPAEVSLSSAYPNPFSRTATVAFALSETQRVRLAVYDVLGREVARLVDERLEAGRHEAVLDGEGLPSGVYLVRLSTTGGTETQRLTLLR